MYEAFYGFTEKPFSLLPDPTFLYPSKKHQMALTMLEYGLANQAPITVVTGEVGSGKTTLVRALLNTIGDDVSVGLISNTHESLGDLMQWVALAFGLQYRGKQKVELYEDFVQFTVDEYARGRRTVLIIDEAQNMSVESLEELRLLSNVNADKSQVLQLLLVGQPELRATLNRQELRQFAQRIASSFHLSSLNREETGEYIGHRLEVAGGRRDLFDDPAKQAVWYHSRGIPRVINTLCDMALVYGFAEERPRIDQTLVRCVVEDRKEGGFFSGSQEDREQAPVGEGRKA